MTLMKAGKGMKNLKYSLNGSLSEPVNGFDELWLELESVCPDELYCVKITLSLGRFEPEKSIHAEVKKDGYIMSDFRYIILGEAVKLGAKLLTEVLEGQQMTGNMFIAVDVFFNQIREVFDLMWYQFLEYIIEG